MSAFYGMVIGNAVTPASRSGTDEITVSAQSWNGSLITRLYYKGNTLMVDLEHSTGSHAYGQTVFNGSLDSLLETLKKDCHKDSQNEEV